MQRSTTRLFPLATRYPWKIGIPRTMVVAYLLYDWSGLLRLLLTLNCVEGRRCRAPHSRSTDRHGLPRAHAIAVSITVGDFASNCPRATAATAILDLSAIRLVHLVCVHGTHVALGLCLEWLYATTSADDAIPGIDVLIVSVCHEQISGRVSLTIC